MDVAMVSGRAVVGSFPTGRRLGQAPSLVRLARRNPEGIIFGLLEQAKQAGDESRAEALYAKANELFELVVA